MKTFLILDTALRPLREIQLSGREHGWDYAQEYLTSFPTGTIMVEVVNPQAMKSASLQRRGQYLIEVGSERVIAHIIVKNEDGQLTFLDPPTN